MRIIHKNDVVLATVDSGASLKGVLSALGLSDTDVSIISLDAAESARLQGRNWSVQSGRVVMGAPVSNTVPPVPTRPATDAERIAKLETAVANLTATVAALKASTTRP